MSLVPGIAGAAAAAMTFAYLLTRRQKAMDHRAAAAAGAISQAAAEVEPVQEVQA
jgi:hypothetical protein